MQIIQMVSSISPGDAVGNDIRALDRMLREEGYASEIYAERIDPRLEGNGIHCVGELPPLAPDDIILYHACISTDLNLQFLDYGGKKVMIYHNITPAHYFEHYSPDSARSCLRGEIQIASIAERVDYCIAVSDYNRQQLLAMGFKCPIDVCPILIPFEDYHKAPDEAILQKYQGDGWTNLLFVGRIVPNKGFQHIISAFAAYHKRYNPKSRLFLVGNPTGMEAYVDDLNQYAAKLDVQEHIFFSGHIRFPEILAYYRLADVFVCMSAHEGFCVPLAEAMEFGIPIVAYDSSAIAETLGKGGILLDNTDPYLAAGVINRIVEDPKLKDYLLSQQKEELKRFRYETVKKRFLECLQNVL